MDYLGMQIFTKKAETLKAAEKETKKKIMAMKGEFRCQTPTLSHALTVAYVRSVVRYQYTPLCAARMITRKDVDHREAVLTKKILGIAASANQAAVMNVYGLHFANLGDEVARAGTLLRQFTIELNDKRSTIDEHIWFEDLRIKEERLEELAPEEYKKYKSKEAKDKKAFNKSRSEVVQLPLHIST